METTPRFRRPFDGVHRRHIAPRECSGRYLLAPDNGNSTVAIATRMKRQGLPLPARSYSTYRDAPKKEPAVAPLVASAAVSAAAPPAVPPPLSTVE